MLIVVGALNSTASKYCFILRTSVVFFCIPSMTNQSILPRHRLGRNNTLTPRHKAPSSRSKGLVEDASVFDFRKVDDSVGFVFYVVAVHFFVEYAHEFRREGP